MAKNPQSIINFARTLIGSHYLWGSGGSTPGNKDGVWYRQDAVTKAPSSTKPDSPSIFTAQCNIDGHYVCAGRFDKIRGGRYAKATDADLKTYLAGLANLPFEEQWCPYFTSFSPRVVRGSNVSNDGRIVWGEDCRNVRHFDCISFVNYVLSRKTVAYWSSDIDHYKEAGSQTTKVEMTDPVFPGDILLRGSTHIGFLCENGRVIQAEDHATGVHEDELYAPTKWTDRRRLPASMII
jgi:cell wall-associated NlpC family hydrolase